MRKVYVLSFIQFCCTLKYVYYLLNSIHFDNKYILFVFTEKMSGNVRLYIAVPVLFSVVCVCALGKYFFLDCIQCICCEPNDTLHCILYLQKNSNLLETILFYEFDKIDLNDIKNLEFLSLYSFDNMKHQASILLYMLMYFSKSLFRIKKALI